ncbi:MAG: IS1634 family transposase, partial [Acidimicrobiales bacterium]
WRNLAHELDRMHLGTFTGTAGTVQRRTTTTTAQTGILRALDLAEPAQFSDLRPARTPAA